MTGHVGKRTRFAYELLSASVREHQAVRGARMAAAIAYRAFFSLAPLLIIAVSVFGMILGSDSAAQAEILAAVEKAAGAEAAAAVEVLLASTVDGADTAAVVGAALLLWAASSLFAQVQRDLNDIFRVPRERRAGVVAFVRKRVIGLGWALGLGLALAAVWLVNLLWRFLGDLFPDDLAQLHSLIGLLTPLVSVVLLPAIFGLSLQTMTATRVRWKAIRFGALVTTAVSLLAAHGVGLYFAWDEDTAAVTVVGSVLIVLLMAYVLAGAFLFGAVMTKVYGDYLEHGDLKPPSARLAERGPGG